MPFMDEEQVASALSQVCCICGVAAGLECVHPVSGKPLLDVVGRPVHIARLEP